jgi:hypothetical protein
LDHLHVLLKLEVAATHTATQAIVSAQDQIVERQAREAKVVRAKLGQELYGIRVQLPRETWML